jgi:hypothetical protein
VHRDLVPKAALAAIVIVTLGVVLSACGRVHDSRAINGSGAPEREWLTSTDSEVIPILSEQLPSNWVHPVASTELAAALKMLSARSAVQLQGQDLENFPSLPQEMTGSGDHLYLVRGEDDADAGGRFHVYRKGAAVAVMFGHMGACGPVRRTAVIVRSSAKIDRVYGGCSGTQ